MPTTLHFVALLCYTLTVGVVVVPLLRLREVHQSIAVPLSLTGTAVAVHFIALLAYARAVGTLPLAGFAPALSSLGFLLGLLTLAVEWITRESAIAVVVGPLVLLVMVVALASGFGPAPSVPVQGGSWFVLHVAASLLGLALMAVAFAAAALYLLQHRELKQRKFGAAFHFLPPLEQLDRLNHLALVVGFPVLTLGLILAARYVGDFSNAGGEKAAHLGWGLLSWVVLGAIAAARIRGGLSGRKAALASILGFAAVAAAYLVLAALAGGGSRFI
ncbi:MAG: cytochrome c biogenesis protein CcsA [Gemmatimonadetes bacterium]|nr:cytochrome c biogenesis protein CcsA [Gemmatimonadota bacterium]